MDEEAAWQRRLNSVASRTSKTLASEKAAFSVRKKGQLPERSRDSLEEWAESRGHDSADSGSDSEPWSSAYGTPSRRQPVPTLPKTHAQSTPARSPAMRWRDDGAGAGASTGTFRPAVSATGLRGNYGGSDIGQPASARSSTRSSAHSAHSEPPRAAAAHPGGSSFEAQLDARIKAIESRVHSSPTRALRLGLGIGAGIGDEAPPAGELNSVTTLPHGLGAGVELGSQTRHAAMGLNVRASDRVVSDELITERKYRAGIEKALKAEVVYRDQLKLRMEQQLEAAEAAREAAETAAERAHDALHEERRKLSREQEDMRRARAEIASLKDRVRELHAARDDACEELARESQLRHRHEKDLARAQEYSQELEGLYRAALRRREEDTLQGRTGGTDGL